MDPLSLLLLVGVAGLLLLQVSRVRRQQREVQAVQAGMTVGAEVLTAAGMVATVSALDESTVTLRSADGHETRWVRGAVVRVVPETDPTSSRYDPEAGADHAEPAGLDDDTTPDTPTERAP